MDCSLPGASVQVILQARNLEWAAIPFSRGSSQSRDPIWVFCMAGRFFIILPLTLILLHNPTVFPYPGFLMLSLRFYVFLSSQTSNTICLCRDNWSNQKKIFTTHPLYLLTNLYPQTQYLPCTMDGLSLWLLSLSPSWVLSLLLQHMVTHSFYHSQLSPATLVFLSGSYYSHKRASKLLFLPTKRNPKALNSFDSFLSLLLSIFLLPFIENSFFSSFTEVELIYKNVTHV